jgi:O-antigen ligase
VVLIALCGLVMALFAVAQYVTPGLQAGGMAGLASVAGGGEMAYVDPEGIASGAAIRVSGLAGHSNWLAFTILLILPLNVYWHSTMKTWKGKTFVAGVVLIELAALVFTFTRLGLVAGFALAVVALLKRLVRMNPNRIVALAVALMIAWAALPGAYKERVLSFSRYGEGESTAARVELQQFAWQYMRDFPIAGVGLGGFGLKFYDENTRYAAMLRWMNRTLGWNPVYYGPHNMYLQLGCETGAVGLALMALILVSALYNAQRAERLFKAVNDRELALLAGSVTVSLIGVVFCALFLHALHQKIWWMVLAVATVLPLYAQTSLRKSNGTSVANGVGGRDGLPSSTPV